MTKKEFRKKYKIRFLQPKTILKLQSNKINFKEIVSDEFKKNFNFEEFTKEKLEDIKKQNLNDLNMLKKIVLWTKILESLALLSFIIILPIVIVYFKKILNTIGYGGPHWTLFVITFILVFSPVIVIYIYYPKRCYLNNREILEKTKNCFIQNPENFPLTVRLLYFPEDSQFLSRISKLRVITLTTENIQKNIFLKAGYNFEKYSNGSMWGNIRTGTEFTYFVSKFCDYVLETYYNEPITK